jgi:hypothetical protein
MRRRRGSSGMKEYMEKGLELERELDAALTGLMEKHKPDTFEASSS